MGLKFSGHRRKLDRAEASRKHEGGLGASDNLPSFPSFCKIHRSGSTSELTQPKRVSQSQRRCANPSSPHRSIVVFHRKS